MIFDTITNVTSYFGIHENLDRALTFLQEHNISDLDLGRHDIYGDQVNVNIVESDLIKESDGIYELHKKYLDLHVDISGEERILCGKNELERIEKEYDEEGDYALLKADRFGECIINQNTFAICMLDEPHMPCLQTGNCNYVRKAIFKIKVS